MFPKLAIYLSGIPYITQRHNFMIDRQSKTSCNAILHCITPEHPPPPRTLPPCLPPPPSPPPPPPPRCRY